MTFTGRHDPGRAPGSCHAYLPGVPEPDRESAGTTADRGLQRSGQGAGIENGARLSCRTEEIVAQGDIRMVRGGHFHQAACHIDRIADGRDVLVTVAAEAGCADRPIMRPDLVADAG